MLPHIADGETEAQRLCGLPQSPQLQAGRAGNGPQILPFSTTLCHLPKRILASQKLATSKYHLGFAVFLMKKIFALILREGIERLKWRKL